MRIPHARPLLSHARRVRHAHPARADGYVLHISHATVAATHARDAFAAHISRAIGVASCVRDAPAAHVRCACPARRMHHSRPFHFPFSSLPFPTCISPTTTIKHQQQPKYLIHHQCNQHNTTTKHNNVGFSITHLGFPIFVFDFRDLRRFST